MGFDQELRSLYPLACTTSCYKEGCRLRLDKLSRPPTILDADEYVREYTRPDKICDYFIFFPANELLVAVVEMKATLDARRAVEQLRAGAAECDRIAGTRRVASFYPIVLSQRIGHTVQLTVLGKKENWVSFRGRHYQTIQKKCGAQLAEIISGP